MALPNHRPGPVLVVAEVSHQRNPRLRDTDGVPAGAGRLAENPNRESHGITESKASAALPRIGGIVERIDDLHLLYEEPAPPWVTILGSGVLSFDLT